MQEIRFIPCKAFKEKPADETKLGLAKSSPITVL